MTRDESSVLSMPVGIIRTATNSVEANEENTLSFEVRCKKKESLIQADPQQIGGPCWSGLVWNNLARNLVQWDAPLWRPADR